MESSRVSDEQVAEGHLYCPECDYDLTGYVSDRCSACGWVVNPLELLTTTTSSVQGRRIATVLVCTITAAGSAMMCWLLISRGNSLHLRDAFTVMAVGLAIVGHLGLAYLAAFSRDRWPLRRGEASTLLLVLGWISFLSAMVGATSGWSIASSPLYNRHGVKLNGALEFILLCVFFTAPALCLLIMRLVSFRTGVTPNAIETARLTSAKGEDRHTLPFRLEFARPLTADQVEVTWNSSPTPRTEFLDDVIAGTWFEQSTMAKKENRELFDGRLARLLRAELYDEGLSLACGPTCYRDFVGTNLYNAALTRELGDEYFADPLGVSVLPMTVDGWLVLGRRSPWVAFHAGCIHTIGGMLECEHGDPNVVPDPWGCAFKELSEETGVRQNDTVTMTIVGLARDLHIHQPELLFETSLAINRAGVRSRFSLILGGAEHVQDAQPAERAEHTELVFVYDDPTSVMSFLLNTPSVTPIAQSALLVHGRLIWGMDWFEQTCLVLYGDIAACAVG